MGFHPKRAWTDKWIPHQCFPFVCSTCCASGGQHVAPSCNFFQGAVVDLGRWFVTCELDKCYASKEKERKGKWRHSQFYTENRCTTVTPIREVNTEELRVRVRPTEKGTWTSEQAWVLGRSQLKHQPCATSSESLNSLDKFFNLLHAFGNSTYGET